MRLDHLVVHIDDDPGILSDLRPSLDAAWLHYRPSRGPTGPGTKSDYIRAGNVVIELVRLQRPGNQSWYPHWLDRSRAGKRGLFSVVLETANIERLADELRGRGMEPRGPETLQFPLLFGLLKTSAPWKILFLPPFPGTGLDISFIQYEGSNENPEPQDEEPTRIAVIGLELHIPDWEENLSVLRKVFPWLTPEGERWSLGLENSRLSFLPGEDRVVARLRTAARGAGRSPGKMVTIQDLVVTVD